MKSNDNDPSIRILPDICVLISHTLSRVIELGFLNSFEILIPDFIENIVEDLCEGKLKAGFYNEIGKLKELERDRKIDILYCSYGVDLPENKKELVDTEDDIILEVAVSTNSILFTADKGLKDKAVSVKQPVIFIPPKFQKNIKELAMKYNFSKNG
jgi:predicted PilT family ATPase